MNPPKVIANANPPKEWFQIVGRGLEPRADGSN
jgi:hypothetical protein